MGRKRLGNGKRDPFVRADERKEGRRDGKKASFAWVFNNQ
jgi:hypothetical protein